MLNIFGRCRKCGVKFGRKTAFCYNCLAHTSLAGENVNKNARRKVIRFMPIALAVIAGLILFIFFRAQKLGISMW